MSRDLVKNITTVAYPSLWEDKQVSKIKSHIASSTINFEPLAYLEMFEIQYPEIFSLFELIGIHPTRSPAKVLNPYSKKREKNTFQNIGEHSIAVAYVAQQIAQHLNFSQQDFQSLTKRALLHDFLKPLEIMKKELNSKPSQKGLKEGQLKKLESQYIEELKISPQLSDLINQSAKETGHQNLKNFIVTGHRSFEVKLPRETDTPLITAIVHLADDMTATGLINKSGKAQTFIVPPYQRIIASNFIDKYPWMWEQGLAFDLSKQDFVEIKNIQKISKNQTLVGNYADLQVFVAEGLCKKIQSFIEPYSTLNPTDFIKELVSPSLSYELRTMPIPVRSQKTKA